MERPPFLSIVTPTRGDFSEAWLRHLVAVEGDVAEGEFVGDALADGEQAQAGALEADLQ